MKTGWLFEVDSVTELQWIKAKFGKNGLERVLFPFYADKDHKMSASDINVEEFINDIYIRPAIWNGSFGSKDSFWQEISANHNNISSNS